MIQDRPSRLRHVRCTVHGIAMGIVLSALAGCVARNQTAAAPTLERLAASPAPGGWTTLSSTSALVRLPASVGAVTSVGESLSAEGALQEIALAGPGDAGRNRIKVIVQRAPGRDAAKPSEAGIRSEIAAAFPNQPMRVVETPRHNAFGPYGLAVGVTQGGVRCVYAWQWLDGRDRLVAARLGGSATWRTRLCRRDATLDQIAAALDELFIGVAPARAGALESPVIRGPQADAPKPKRTVKGVPDRSPPTEPVSDITTIRPGSGRYLAPVANAPAPASSSSEAARPALDGSLPAEAYRGPTQRSGPAPRASADWRTAVQVPN